MNVCTAKGHYIVRTRHRCSTRLREQSPRVVESAALNERAQGQNGLPATQPPSHAGRDHQGKFVLISGRQSGLLKQEPRVLSAPLWTLAGGLMAMVRCDCDFLDRDRRLRRDSGMTGRFSGPEGWRRSRTEGALSQALSAGWCSWSSSGSRGRGADSWQDGAWSERRRARALDEGRWRSGAVGSCSADRARCGCGCGPRRSSSRGCGELPRIIHRTAPLPVEVSGIPTQHPTSLVSQQLFE